MSSLSAQVVASLQPNRHQNSKRRMITTRLGSNHPPFELVLPTLDSRPAVRLSQIQPAAGKLPQQLLRCIAPGKYKSHPTKQHQTGNPGEQSRITRAGLGKVSILLGCWGVLSL